MNFCFHNDQFLRSEDDMENLFRGTVALGTLVLGHPNARDAAKLAECEATLAKISQTQTEGKLLLASKQTLAAVRA
jgi:hypothetical protein